MIDLSACKKPRAPTIRYRPRRGSRLVGAGVADQRLNRRDSSLQTIKPNSDHSPISISGSAPRDLPSPLRFMMSSSRAMVTWPAGLKETDVFLNTKHSRGVDCVYGRVTSASADVRRARVGEVNPYFGGLSPSAADGWAHIPRCKRHLIWSKTFGNPNPVERTIRALPNLLRPLH